jgi:hypothetical protein
MNSNELIVATNTLVRRLTQRIESGSISPTAAYSSKDAALRAIEDAIVELVMAHARLQKELK